MTTIVQDRVGHRVLWAQGTSEDAEVSQAIATLLADELSAAAAVQIALLSNRRLQATYEDLGIAQADLVQAGLLRNPVFLGVARFSDSSSSGTNTEFSLVQDFLDIFLRPARKKLAAAEFEAAKLRVANAVLILAAETKSAYYRLQGDMHLTAMLRTITEASEAANSFAQRQHAAGNIADLDLAAQRGLYEQARVELVISEAAVMSHRERLTRLMGLWGMNTQWRISERLPNIPEEELPLAHLESLAISQRLDLAAERWEVERIAKALSITIHWRYVPLLEVGMETEREPDGERVTGPSLAIALPVFDQGQARVARVESILRQSRQRMAALAIDIRSEVRDGRNQLQLARELADHYRTVLIPVREQIVAESQRYYNFMLIGVYQLLEAKQDEIDAYRGYIEAVRDYWVARANLERTVGGRLALTAARREAGHAHENEPPR
ncbi:MAG: TolC family protein [Acidobacteria bacterium]|nr:TolC family protein [Acidobacteriota bacterium]